MSSNQYEKQQPNNQPQFNPQKVVQYEGQQVQSSNAQTQMETIESQNHAQIQFQNSQVNNYGGAIQQQQHQVQQQYDYGPSQNSVRKNDLVHLEQEGIQYNVIPIHEHAFSCNQFDDQHLQQDSSEEFNLSGGLVQHGHAPSSMAQIDPNHILNQFSEQNMNSNIQLQPQQNFSILNAGSAITTTQPVGNFDENSVGMFEPSIINVELNQQIQPQQQSNQNIPQVKKEQISDQHEFKIPIVTPQLAQFKGNQQNQSNQVQQIKQNQLNQQQQIVSMQAQSSPQQRQLAQGQISNANQGVVQQKPMQNQSQGVAQKPMTQYISNQGQANNPNCPVTSIIMKASKDAYKAAISHKQAIKAVQEKQMQDANQQHTTHTQQQTQNYHQASASQQQISASQQQISAGQQQNTTNTQSQQQQSQYQLSQASAVIQNEQQPKQVQKAPNQSQSNMFSIKDNISLEMGLVGCMDHTQVAENQEILKNIGELLHQQKLKVKDQQKQLQQIQNQQQQNQQQTQQFVAHTQPGQVGQMVHQQQQPSQQLNMTQFPNHLAGTAQQHTQQQQQQNTTQQQVIQSQSQVPIIQQQQTQNQFQPSVQQQQQQVGVQQQIKLQQHQQAAVQQVTQQQHIQGIHSVHQQQQLQQQQQVTQPQPPIMQQVHQPRVAQPPPASTAQQQQQPLAPALGIQNQNQPQSAQLNQSTQQTAKQLSQFITLLTQLQQQLENGGPLTQDMANETNGTIQAIGKALSQAQIIPTQIQPKQEQHAGQQQFQLRQPMEQSTVQEAKPVGDPVYIKFFIGGILYSTKEQDIEYYFKNTGKVIDVAVMRDKSSGRSRGFAFITFVVHTTEKGVKPANCKVVQELNQKMLQPQVPHQIQNKIIEIRQSDGGKPQDSFIMKKNQKLQNDDSSHRNRDNSGSKNQREGRGQDRSRDKYRDNSRNDRRDSKGNRKSDRKNLDSRDSRDRRSKNDGRHRRSSRSRSSSRDHWDKNSISGGYSDISDDRGALRNKKSYTRDNSRGRNYDSADNTKPLKGAKKQDKVQMRYSFDQKRHDREMSKLTSSSNSHIRDRVFVGGLDYNLNDQDLSRHFAQWGQVQEAQIIRDPITKSSRGFGFVKFVDYKIAEKLITKIQVTTINGRRVDMRTADQKMPPDKIAQINRQVQNDYSPADDISKSYMIPQINPNVPQINPNAVVVQQQFPTTTIPKGSDSYE